MAKNVYSTYNQYTDPIKAQVLKITSNMRRIFILLIVSILLATSISTAQTAENELTGEYIAPIEQAKHYYYVSYAQDAEKDLQNRFGDNIEGYNPSRESYIIYTTQRVLKQLQEQEKVLSFTKYKPQITVDRKTRNYLILPFRNADEQALAEKLKERDIKVRKVHERLIQIETHTKHIRNLKDVEGIQTIELRRDYVTFNAIATQVSGIVTARQNLGLYGENQIITILDKGLDTGQIGNLHPDFGNVLSITDIFDSYFFCCSDLGVDYSSHGTHVSGVALGNGMKSGSSPGGRTYGGSNAGAAPEAQLVFQAAGGNQGANFIPQIPIFLSAFTPAQQQGSYIHSNSWGTLATGGVYTFDAQDIDFYTWNNKEFNIIFSAGNVPGPGTVSPPSTAKNSISVSGVESLNPQQHRYAEGPTLDGRFKPDLVAPAMTQLGVGILSTKSSMQLPFPVGCLNGPSPDYCEMAGTSQAAPHVAGSVALVREYLQTERRIANPSAALVKAILINGAQSVGGQPIPSNQNGWGRLDVANSLTLGTRSKLFIEEQNQGMVTGDLDTYNYNRVSSSEPLVITLVWTDAPGVATIGSQKQLVNNIDLRVIDPHGNVFNGNDIVAPYDDTVDDTNNVEQVRIAQPIQGRYKIEVDGLSIPISGQDYAFAISYAPIRASDRQVDCKDTVRC